MTRLHTHGRHSSFFPAHLVSITGSEPPGYWSSSVVNGLETTLCQIANPAVSLPEIISAGHLLYLHYLDRLEWSDAERVLSYVVDLPGADRPARGDSPFDPVNTLHAIHLSLRGCNRLGGRSALGRVSPRSSVQRSPLAVGARAAISLAAGDYDGASHLANQIMRATNRRPVTSGIDRLMLSWWQEIIVRANASLRPQPLTCSPRHLPATDRLIAFPIERIPAMVTSDRFAWDPGVPSDYRAEWIFRQRPASDLTA